MNEFQKFHPVVNFVYFIFVIGFSMFFMHPVCLLISFICAFSYSLLLGGKKAIKINLIYMIPMIITAMVMNPVFNHRGITVIGHFLNGAPVTLESVIYGFFAAVMIVSVICWFSCFNVVITSDKIVYVLGKASPSLALVFTMVLRFVPRFTIQFKEVLNAQKCIGNDISDGSVLKRIKTGLSVLSVMLTRSLEDSVETADSMKSRGYGLSGHTTFSPFKFKMRDTMVLSLTVLLSAYILTGYFMGAFKFEFFPAVKVSGLSVFGISVFVSYIILCALPVIIEVREALKWKLSKQKI